MRRALPLLMAQSGHAIRFNACPLMRGKTDSARTLISRAASHERSWNGRP
jgi:hypothetical protein